MNSLGGRIQQLRKAMELTQNQLAKRIEVSHTQMARYEIKDVQPPADVLKKLADVFDTSIDFLVRGDIDAKAAESLEDAELIKQLKQINDLPKEDKNTVLKFVGAYIRDFKAKQAYAS